MVSGRGSSTIVISEYESSVIVLSEDGNGKWSAIMDAALVSGWDESSSKCLVAVVPEQSSGTANNITVNHISCSVVPVRHPNQII